MTKKEAIHFLYQIADEIRSFLDKTSSPKGQWTSHKRLEALSMAISALYDLFQAEEDCVSNLRRSGSCHRSTEGRQRVMTNYENLKAAAQSLGDFCDNHEDCDGCTLSALCECMPAALPKLINAIAENKEKSGGKK